MNWYEQFETDINSLKPELNNPVGALVGRFLLLKISAIFWADFQLEILPI